MEKRERERQMKEKERIEKRRKQREKVEQIEKERREKQRIEKERIEQLKKENALKRQLREKEKLKMKEKEIKISYKNLKNKKFIIKNEEEEDNINYEEDEEENQISSRKIKKDSEKKLRFLEYEDDEKIENNIHTKKLNRDEETDDEISEENYEEIIHENKHISKNTNLKFLKQRKPISRTMYDNLLEKMIYIINKYKEEINVSPNNCNNIYKDILDKYIQNLEKKIIIMKNGYLQTLIKKHYCNNYEKKREIMIKGNIPHKRNEVKICFNDLTSFIKNYLKDKKDVQKYYYILIINILNKYDNITGENILMAKKLFKENKLDILNYIEENKNDDNDNDKTKNLWIRQTKSKKGKILKLFTIALPFACILTYFYNFYNA